MKYNKENMSFSLKITFSLSLSRIATVKVHLVLELVRNEAHGHKPLPPPALIYLPLVKPGKPDYKAFCCNNTLM